jgi:hypothetical protein
MERCGDRAQGRSRIIAPLDPNERRRSFWEITAPQEGAKISPPAIHASISQQKTITPNDALCLGSLRAGEGSN